MSTGRTVGAANWQLILFVLGIGRSDTKIQINGQLVIAVTVVMKGALIELAGVTCAL